MTEIVIELPLPPRELSPNSRVHPLQRAHDARRVRRETSYVARGALVQHGLVSPRWNRAHVQYTWRSPRGPLPDPDNVIAHCKAVLDGLVDAELLADDREVSVAARVERGKPCLIVTVVPITEGSR
jgi:crossover junction endodeoxyribonuclease RusA